MPMEYYLVFLFKRSWFRYPNILLVSWKIIINYERKKYLNLFETWSLPCFNLIVNIFNFNCPRTAMFPNLSNQISPIVVGLFNDTFIIYNKKKILPLFVVGPYISVTLSLSFTRVWLLMHRKRRNLLRNKSGNTWSKKIWNLDCRKGRKCTLLN